MVIMRIKTLHLKKSPRIIWVVLETDEGITSLGETIPKPSTARAIIHETLSGFLPG